MAQNGQPTATTSRSGVDRLLGAFLVDALIGRFVDEGHAAAAAAAEALVAAALHLDLPRAAELRQQVAGRVVLAVVAAEVAGIVERDRFAAVCFRARAVRL